MTIKHCLTKVIVPFLLFAAPGWAQEQAKPAPGRSPEAALAVVARHLSDQYALYLYESLTAQVLFNEGILTFQLSTRPEGQGFPLGAGDYL